jgi:alanine dehydrogenase
MKFGILKELKSPPDRRVVFSPDALLELQKQYPDFLVQIESSETRIFSDQLYIDAGFEVVTDLSGCDVLIGIKEMPVANVLANKTYFFFSHTIKKQAANKALLQAILEKNGTLYDHEAIVNQENRRLIGFGGYAGFVGAYNSIRAFGTKYGLFNLPKPSTLSGKAQMIGYLKRIVLPPLKFVITGKGKVGNGVIEILKVLKVKEVTKENFLTKKYAQSVFVQLGVADYTKKSTDGSFDFDDFVQNPNDYESDFEQFTQVSDIYLAGHFHAIGAPNILTVAMLQSKDCQIKIVADISCDLDGSIACSLRKSTNDAPFYGYLPSKNEEVDIFHPAALVVMAVDNLPSELPLDASIGFGEMFCTHVMPAFFNNDKDGVLERAKITQNGKLTPRFEYLQDYVGGN